MNKLNHTFNENNKILALLVALVFLAVIVFFMIRMNNNTNQGPSVDSVVNGITNLMGTDLDEILRNSTPYFPEGADINDPDVIIPETLKEAVVTVVGANPIAKNGVVLTSSGEVARNDVTPMSLDAPRQSPPVNKDDLSASVIKLDISADGWKPNEILVKAGMPITLAITSVDEYTHLFAFDDASLSSIAVLVSSNETRAITFNAPTEAGEYTFRCDIPGHAIQGEVGKLMVE
jgi:uncharacterized cupredoxin-like copper-binding protein